MEIIKENAEQLVEQLQHAHRISVAFYRRFLPILDDIANQLGCQFVSWNPLETNMGCRSSTRPSNKWAWDFVPLFASRHIYWRTEGKIARHQDIGLSLCLYIDDSFSSEKREQNKIKGQPDAVTLPMGNAVLQTYVFRPTKNPKKSFADLWDESDDPELGLEEMQEVCSNMQAIAFEWKLADVLHNHQQVIDKLKLYIE